MVFKCLVKIPFLVKVESHLGPGQGKVDPLSITVDFTSGSKVASRLWTGKSRAIWIMEPMGVLGQVAF